MNEEETLIRKISAAPDDNQARLVYADWLQQRGDRRAEILIAMAAGRMPEPQVVDLRWFARMDRAKIVGCMLEEPHCPLRWQDLLPRGRDPLVRFCAECCCEVFYCASLEEARVREERGERSVLSSMLSREVGGTRLR